MSIVFYLVAPHNFKSEKCVNHFFIKFIKHSKAVATLSEFPSDRRAICEYVAIVSSHTAAFSKRLVVAGNVSD